MSNLIWDITRSLSNRPFVIAGGSLDYANPVTGTLEKLSATENVLIFSLDSGMTSAKANVTAAVLIQMKIEFLSAQRWQVLLPDDTNVGPLVKDAGTVSLKHLGELAEATIEGKIPDLSQARLMVVDQLEGSPDGLYFIQDDAEAVAFLAEATGMIPHAESLVFPVSTTGIFE